MRVSACCVHAPPQQSVSQVDFVNDAYLRDQRDQSLQHSPSGCEACARQEKSGILSYRQQANQWYQQGFPDSDPYLPQLLKLDYNVDPVCNAKCITCSSFWSSAWAEEDRQFGVEVPDRQFRLTHGNRPVESLPCDDLTRVYFNGGEPLLSPEPQRLLERILEKRRTLEHLHCQTSTNGSIRPGQELIALWHQCQKVDVMVSLDGVLGTFEYIRNPLQWSQVWQNIRYMGSLAPHIQVSFSFTVGVHNIDHIQQAVSFVTENCHDINGGDYGYNRCLGPLSLDSASTVLVDHWKRKFTSTLDQPVWVRNLSALLVDVQGASNNEQWQQRLAMIDHRRGSTWQENLPDLVETLKYMGL